MSNAPDDERPQSDVADQLAGTPAADVDTTATDAPADDTTHADDSAADEEPAPLVEPDAPAQAEFLAPGESLTQAEPAADHDTGRDGSSASNNDTAAENQFAPRADAPVAASAAGADATAASEPTAAAEATPLPQGVNAPEPAGEPTPYAMPTSSAPAAAAHPVSDPIVSQAPASAQTVYVTAPTPPKKRSNRGVGTVLAVLGAIAFGLLHSLITAIAYLAAGRSFDVARFLQSTGFLVPTIVFLVVFVLAVLLINRAGWWAWVLGSLVIAVVTYFASIGIIMLLENAVALTPAQGQELFEQLAVSAPLVIAVLVAREVAIWFGLAIAARGRKVKARNAEARATYDHELAESRQRYAS